jgi:L-threonylcarbamoyladenylate synthase
MNDSKSGVTQADVKHPCLSTEQATEVLQQGKVLAYPTEAVWGLGCDPFNKQAVEQILSLKQRPMAKGLIIVAASISQLTPLWDELPLDIRERIAPTWPGPMTWILPDEGWMPAWVKGSHSSLAVRVSAHPSIQSLCKAFGGPVVSTSANLSSQAPALDKIKIQQYFPGVPMLEGHLGDLSQPTQIRDAASGKVLR